MAGKRFRAEQIIMKLREAEVGLAQGQRVGPAGATVAGWVSHPLKIAAFSRRTA